MQYETVRLRGKSKVEFVQSVEQWSHRIDKTGCLGVEKESECTREGQVEATGRASRQLVVQYRDPIGVLQCQGEYFSFARSKIGNER